MAGLLANGTRAVLFDFDGTLVDANHLVTEAGAKMLAEAGYHLTPAQVSQGLASRTFKRLCAEVVQMPADEVDAFYADFVDTFYSRYAPSARPFPHAESLLLTLRELPLQLALVTNRIERGAHLGIDAAGWTDHFDVVVGQDTTPHPKPHPGPALFALDALGLQPGEAIFVGDNETDVLCGVNAGLAAVVAIATGTKANHLVALGATHTVPDLIGLHELLFGSPPR